MPSGFQQDQNQLTPSYYRVTIQCGNGNATWYATGDGDGTNEGRISAYAWDNFPLEDCPSTLASARALARGNLRFQYIVEAIENLADCQILDIEHQANPNGDDMAGNSWINFTVKFDRDEGVFPALCAIKRKQQYNINGQVTIDGVTYNIYDAYVGDGNTINNTEDAIRDVIFYAMWQYDPVAENDVVRSRSVRVFQPVEGSDPFVGEGVQEVITTTKPWSDDIDAWSDIQVNELDGTTTTITHD